MAIAKKTLYEILEVSPNASLPVIQAAHRLLCRNLLMGKPGLSREDIDFNLKLYDLALHTLSDQSSRDAYDVQLPARNLPVIAVVPLRADATSLKIAAAIEQNQEIGSAIERSNESPLKIISATAASSASALRKILTVIAGLLVIGVIIKVSTAVLIGRQSGKASSGVSKAEEKVILQEYYQTHGVRPGSKIEADLLEVERRRKENAEREAVREKKQEDERYRQFVDESRRTGNQVSENLRRDEERVRREEEQKNQQLERDKRNKEEAEREAERVRLDKARQRVGLDPLPQSD